MDVAVSLHSLAFTFRSPLQALPRPRRADSACVVQRSVGPLSRCRCRVQLCPAALCWLRPNSRSRFQYTMHSKGESDLDKEETCHTVCEEEGLSSILYTACYFWGEGGGEGGRRKSYRRSCRDSVASTFLAVVSCLGLSCRLGPAAAVTSLLLDNDTYARISWPSISRKTPQQVSTAVRLHIVLHGRGSGSEKWPAAACHAHSAAAHQSLAFSSGTPEPAEPGPGAD